MARCSSCNKFVSFDEVDPEVNRLEVDEDGRVTAEIRIVNACAECGEELTGATLELEANVEGLTEKAGGAVAYLHQGDGHELEIEETGSERTSRSGNFKKGVFVPGGGRYAKTFYGASVTFKVTCACGKLEVEGSMEGDEQASAMDSLS